MYSNVWRGINQIIVAFLAAGDGVVAMVKQQISQTHGLTPLPLPLFPHAMQMDQFSSIIPRRMKALISATAKKESASKCSVIMDRACSGLDCKGVRRTFDGCPKTP